MICSFQKNIIILSIFVQRYICGNFLEIHLSIFLKHHKILNLGSSDKTLGRLHIFEILPFSGPGLVFKTYPVAVSLLPLPNLWAILFFLMAFLLGVDGQVNFIQSF